MFLAGLGVSAVLPALPAQAATACSATQWSASYYNSTAPTGAPAGTECVSSVNANWLTGYPSGVGVTGHSFSVVYTRTIAFGSSATASSTFGVKVSGHVVVSVGSTTVLDKTGSSTTSVKGFTGSQPVQVVYASTTSSSLVHLDVTTPSFDGTAPETPGSVKATASSAGITVGWGTVSGAASYAVYRATANSVPVTSANRIGTTSASNTSLLDTGVSSGTTYYYVVTAVDAGGNESSAGSTVHATAVSTPVTGPPPPVSGAPATPAGFKAAFSASTRAVTLSWTKNASGTSGYTVSRATSAAGPFVQLGTTTTNTYTDSAPAANATDYYQLVAVNGTQSSAPANTSVVVPGDTTPPSTPSSGKSTPAANGGVTVSWNPVSASDLAGYTVQKRNDDNVYVAYLPSSGVGTITATSFTDPAVAEGTSAYYRIRAVDTSGNVSNYESITAPVPNVAPAVPSGLSATPSRVHGVVVTWKADTDYDLAGYSVYRSATSSGSYVLLDTIDKATAGSAPSYADTSAPKGVPEYYKIAASDLVGNISKQSSAVSATATTDPAPIVYKTTVLTVGPQGQYQTIPAALSTIPESNLTHYEIDIAPGTYTGAFEIQSPFVTLRGTGLSPSDVIIADNHVAGATDPTDGQPYGTAGSATVFVSGHDDTLSDLTVANTWVEGSDPTITDQQAVALRVEGDRFVASNDRILGNQDTLLADTPKPTTRSRQYYVNSYIEGDVDYIFGAADAVFDHDVLRSLDRGKSDNGEITAASTDGGSKYGYLIVNSRVVSTGAPGTVHLGRPYHPGATTAAKPSVVVKNTWLPSALATASPWVDFVISGVDFRWQDARFSEYQNIGPGATVNANRPQLADKDAAKATPELYLAGSDGWDPVLNTPVTTPAAPLNVVAGSDDRTAYLTWDDVDSADVIGWDVYRSADGGSTYTQVASSVEQTAYTDSGLTNGDTYTYAITAITRGTPPLESPKSTPVTVTITPRPLVPSITVDGSKPGDGISTFRTVAAALAAAPAGTATNPTVIGVEPGTYLEQLTISKNYTYLVGLGNGPQDVRLEFDVAHGTTNPATGAPYGTAGSAAVTDTASNTLVENLTIANEWDPSAHPDITDTQAVALRATGDRQRYLDVRVLGRQDTLEADTPTATTYARSYFANSYIEGTVDFIFGRGTAVFDHDTLHGLNRAGGTLVAPDTSNLNPHGYLFYDSKITADAPDGTFDLGRPWPNLPQSTDPVNYSQAQATIVNSYIGVGINATKPWIDWSPTYAANNGRWFEYGNTGPGAAVNANRPQLTATQAASTTPATWLASSPSINDGWDPSITAYGGAPAAVTNVIATSASRSAVLTWDESADSRVTSYNVYRGGPGGPQLDAAHLVATVARPTYTDTGLTNGTAYTYRVVAVTTDGQVSAPSDPVYATPAVVPLVPTVTVAKDGSADFTTVAAALAAEPAGTPAKPTVIAIEPGTYREVIAVTKPYTVLVGTSGNASDVIITYGNANGTSVSATTCPQVTNATTCGTYGSATATVSANNVTVRDLTISNGFVAAQHPEIGPNSTQAVAVRATGDEQIYDNVRLLGAQDTLNADASGNITADGSGYPRQYYVDSFIEGNVDFVFGRASAVFDRDTFHATVHNGGTVFSPSTAVHANGYLVRDSRIASDNDPGTFFLGRPWRAWSDGAYADNSRGQTVLLDTWMNAGIDSAHPWTDFAPNVWTDGRFDEHGNTGPGAATGANRPQLSDSDAAAITVPGWLNGWDPSAGIDAPSGPVSAPVGVTPSVGDAQVALQWNENTEFDVVGYNVYRSTSATVPTDAAHLLNAKPITTASYVDSGLTNGSSYSYVITAITTDRGESAPSTVVSATPALHIDAVVARDGSGTYTDIQSAVSAIPDGHAGSTVISVKPGTYTGTVTVPASKGTVTILGSTGTAGDVVVTNATTSPTLTVPDSNVTVENMTIANTNGASNTPAVYLTGDKILLENDSLVGTDRTVWADVPTAGATARQLIDNSTISGASNIVLGRATLAIHASTIVPTMTSGTVFIPSTTATNGHGILVIGSTIAPAAGVSDIRLGGPYAQGSTTNTGASINSPETLIRDSIENAGIKSQPWQNFNGYLWTDARFAEYHDTGAGSGVSDLRPQLTPAGSVNYTVSAWLGAATWYPAVADPAVPGDVTAPAAPTAFGATTGNGTADLHWSAPTDPDVASYRLYRSTTSPVAQSYATLVKSGLTATSYSDSGLSNGSTYYYALVALDSAGNVSVPVTLPVTPADTVPPAAPSGVSSGVGDGRVTLSWTANTEVDLAGYNVYSGGAKLTPSLLTSPTFTQSGLMDGTAYSYTVTAVDTAGNESQPSAQVSATPAAGDSTPPAVPSGSAAAPDATLKTPSAAPGTTAATWTPAVRVTWNADTDPDLAGYSVYRSVAGGTPVKLTSGLRTATTYLDSSAMPATSYSYTVTATDGAGNESAPSAPVSAAAPVRVDVVVAADGSGDATTVQGGINLIANNADYTVQGLRTVLVEPGTYPEAVAGGNRYGVNIVGAASDPKSVVITSTTAAPALTLQSKQWTVSNLTLSNTSGTALGATETALKVSAGDKDEFRNMRLLGDAQALQLSTSNTTTAGRLYFDQTYVQGGNYTVIGRAQTVFNHTTFHVLNEPGASIFDSSLDSTLPLGFLIENSSIVTDAHAAVDAGQATASIYLGQPYPDHTTTVAQVTIRSTSLDSGVRTGAPWKDWNAANPWTSGHFFEYQNTGAGAASPTPANRPQLSDDPSSPAWQGNYTAAAYLAGSDNWSPSGSSS